VGRTWYGKSIRKGAKGGFIHEKRALLGGVAEKHGWGKRTENKPIENRLRPMVRRDLTKEKKEALREKERKEQGQYKKNVDKMRKHAARGK